MHLIEIHTNSFTNVWCFADRAS